MYNLTFTCFKGLNNDLVNISRELKETTSQACLCTESFGHRPSHGAWLGESQTTCTSIWCFWLDYLKLTAFAQSWVPLVVSCLYHTPAYLRCLYLWSAGHQVQGVRVHWSCFLSQGLIWYCLLQSKIRPSYSMAAVHVKPSEWAPVTWTGRVLWFPQQNISPVRHSVTLQLSYSFKYLSCFD